MSFSEEQKNVIIEALPRTQCCRRALLEGILAARARLVGGNTVISLSSGAVIKCATALILEVYSKVPTVTSSSSGGRRKIVSFESPAAARCVEGFSGGFIHYNKCQMCDSAFLRGVFLAAGRVSDPSVQYSLEFSVGDRTEPLVEYLQERGLTPRVSKKPKECVVYFKNSNELEDFFALAGMHQTAFALMNEKIQSDIRNSVNRIANCETNNIDKAVSASMEQIALIEALIARGLISHLPDELELTARARMEHKDLSLSQLAAIITPPISKPGLSHRLKKITAIAEELLKKSEK